MFNSLRGRFILSHVLPLLIVIPLLGVAVIYLVESRFLIPSMLSELEGDARLLSRLVEQDVSLWRDPDYASQLLGQASASTSGRLMLLDANGMILASSDSADANRTGTRIELPSLTDLPLGQVAVTRRYSQSLDGEIADAFAPVTGQDGQLLGYIRLSYRFVTFSDELYQLRYLLTSILLVSLLLGAGLGVVLAVNVGAPVQQVTQAVDALANGERNEPLPEYGTLETRRLSHSVNVLLERLRELETARKRLLANLVHEIGRPLGAMRMGIEALSHGAERDPKFYKELLGGMEQESARLQRLLEDLSHLHEQALGVLELDYKEIDLSTWLPQTLAPWGQAALQKRLHWEVTLPPSISPVHADPLRLGQVLGNLVSNAIKFTPSGGTITVSAGEEEQQVWLRVRDTGPGIPPDQQQKMFEPFVRGGHGRRFPQGMGLGLSIAQELVEAHGGRLSLESDAGLGATFTVWLRKSSF
ncbi:MAG TPA: ATP-binding protein [Anaerolineales bacterium]|nr:ATP-binding protein [Anaerolineales bacterium]